MASAKTVTPKEIALDWGISPKTLRKFLRTEARGKGVETPGKGGRWAIPAGSLKSMRKRFDAWNAAEAAKRQAARDAAEAPESDTEGESPDAPETALDALKAALEEIPLEGEDAPETE